MAASEHADAPAQPSNVDKLRDFILAHMPGSVHTIGGVDYSPAFTDDNAADLAHAIFSEFLRTDVEATSLFARAGVDADTLEPFAIVTWGPMVGRLAPVELRSIAFAFVEVAETAEVESAMMRWLESDEGGSGNRDGSLEILRSFRRYRVESGVEREAGE